MASPRSEPKKSVALEETLQKFLGPDGDFISVVLENKTIDAATQLHYLTLAITLPCHEFLKETPNMTSQIAIEEIKGFNLPMAKALIEFYSSGLRGSHLREWQVATHSFFIMSEYNLFKYLLTEQKETPNMTPVLALEEMKGLSGLESNTLKELYAKGLKGSHLREWKQRSPNILFWEVKHLIALTTLLNNGISADNAILVLYGLTGDEALDAAGAAPPANTRRSGPRPGGSVDEVD